MEWPFTATEVTLTKPRFSMAIAAFATGTTESIPPTSGGRVAWWKGANVVVAQYLIIRSFLLTSFVGVPKETLSKLPPIANLATLADMGVLATLFLVAAKQTCRTLQKPFFTMCNGAFILMGKAAVTWATQGVGESMRTEQTVALRAALTCSLLPKLGPVLISGKLVGTARTRPADASQPSPNEILRRPTNIPPILPKPLLTVITTAFGPMLAKASLVPLGLAR